MPTQALGVSLRPIRIQKNTEYYNINDVKEFLERQKVRQFKAYRGFSSYVATEPLQELQIDIADFTASGAVNDGYRYCFVAIDIFYQVLPCSPNKR